MNVGAAWEKGERSQWRELVYVAFMDLQAKQVETGPIIPSRYVGFIWAGFNPSRGSMMGVITMMRDHTNSLRIHG